jgi:diphthine methyl ester acylhydrolase
MHLSIDTVLPADSVEFCPHPDAANVLVCGTYKLEDQRDFQEEPRLLDSISPTSTPAGQIRRGQCLVFEVDSEQDISACALLVFIYELSG